SIAPRMLELASLLFCHIYRYDGRENTNVQSTVPQDRGPVPTPNAPRAGHGVSKERQMSKMVADVLVRALEDIGVRQIFGLIGDSLNPLGDAVRRSKIEWIGVRHEEGAALAAAGQAKLTGRLGVCAGTTGPGSTHLVAGLYEASRDHAPV